MIRSTMSDFPLTINTVLRHGRRVHAGSECVTFTGDGVRRATYRQVADNADRLAAALRRLGIGPGDPVGTFMWNDQEHLEAYFAVPCMGAVLHTLNIRLSREQLVYVTNHAGDRVVVRLHARPLGLRCGHPGDRSTDPRQPRGAERRGVGVAADPR